MKTDNTNMKIYIGAIIVILLQLLICSIISINHVFPNFLLAYTIVCIVLRPDKIHLTFAFIMGLIYDLVFAGPVGSMAFVMVVFAFIISKVLIKINASNLALSLLTILISVFFVEVFYGVFQAAILVDAVFVDILAYRVLPCSIFDVICAFIMFAIMGRILAPSVSINDDNLNINPDNRRW